MVKNNQIKVQSDEARISEKLLANFRRQAERIEEEQLRVAEEITSYTLLDNDVKSIVAGETTVDLKNPDHTRVVAFLKKHVSSILKFFIIYKKSDIII